jgi:hypothetical protein
MSIDKVKADNFYKDDGDKINQNWYLYEYSNKLFSKIEENPKLLSYRKKHKAEGIAAFCVYFSKRLRQSLFNLYSGKTKSIEIDAKYIYELYPDNSYTQTKLLLEAAADAWEEKIQICSNCPNQCMNDGFELTKMFDNLEKTGWPTV